MTSVPQTTSRRWVLVGLFLGTLSGAVPAFLPEPIRSLVLWIAYSVTVANVTTLGILGTGIPAVFHLQKVSAQTWWALIALATLLGAVVGVGLWVVGKPLEGGAIVGSLLCGLFGGYAVAEAYLRHLDAKKHELESLFRD